MDTTYRTDTAEGIPVGDGGQFIMAGRATGLAMAHRHYEQLRRVHTALVTWLQWRRQAPALRPVERRWDRTYTPAPRKKKPFKKGEKVQALGNLELIVPKITMPP